MQAYLTPTAAPEVLAWKDGSAVTLELDGIDIATITRDEARSLAYQILDASREAR